jgi:hypothetical protein
LNARPYPDDAHSRPRFPADKTSHNYNFSLTASVVDGSILDFSMNPLSSNFVAGISLSSESSFGLFSKA